MFRNRLIKDYSRRELEDIFIQSCDQLDVLAEQIVKLNENIEKRQRYKRNVQNDMKSKNKREVEIAGKDVPEAVGSYKFEIKQLKDLLDDLVIKMHRETVKRDDELREVNYFKSLLVFPNKAYKKEKVIINESQDILNMLHTIFSQDMPWEQRDRILSVIHLIKGDTEKAAPFIAKASRINDELVLEQIKMRERIEQANDDIERLNNKLDNLRQYYKEVKVEYHNLEDQRQNAINEAHDRYLERVSLQNRNEKLHQQISKLKILLQKRVDLKEKVENERIQLQGWIDFKSRRTGRKVSNMQKDHSEAEKELENINEKNSELIKYGEEVQAQIDTLLSNLENKRKDVEERRKLMEVARRESTGLRDRYLELISLSNQEVEGSLAFFLKEMTVLNFSPLSLYDLNADIKNTRQMIEKVDKKIESIESKLSELQRISDDLKDFRRKLALDYMASRKSLEEKQRLLGCQGIVIESTQTAFLFSFKNFNGLQNVENSLIYKQRKAFSVTVRFYEQQQASTQLFALSDKEFEGQLLFICDKSWEFDEFIRNSKASIILSELRGKSITFLGATHVELSHFVYSSDDIGGDLTFYDNNQNEIGTMLYRIEMIVKT